MKVIKNEIRPIGFATIELNENEILTILGVFDQLAMYMQDHNYHKGTRKEIQDLLHSLVVTKK